MEIKAKKRAITGKKVKNMREEGLVPGSVYGPKREPMNIVIPNKDFRKIFEEAEYNKLIDLEIEGEKKGAQVLIKEVQVDPITDEYLNVSLYEIDSNQRIVAEVPVNLIGISPAVKNNIGFLVNPIDTIELRCLPKDLPEDITIDVSNLAEIGDGIGLDKIKLPEGVEFANIADLTASIVYIAPPQKEIEEEKPETAEEVEEGEEGEGKEGEEGEKEAGEDAGKTEEEAESGK